MATSDHRCPICRKPTNSRSPQFPFCSERCRTQDLANWASGEYAIPVPATEADEHWEISTAGRRKEGSEDE